MAGDWRVHFPVVGAIFDEEGNPQLNSCRDALLISGGFVKLSQVPYKAKRVSIYGFSETDNLNVGGNQFKVNYVTGRVYFDPSHNGESIVAEYQGIGTLVGVDEINWLWERVQDNATYTYYTALMDTPKALIPRAVQVANKTGTAITQMSPEIGRAYSDVYMLFDHSGDFRIPGSVFDWVTLWRMSTTEGDTTLWDFSTGIAKDLTLTDGVFHAGSTEGRLFCTDACEEAGQKGLLHIGLTQFSGNVRMLISMQGVYYHYADGEWALIGGYTNIAELPAAQWNTAEEIGNLPVSALRKLQGMSVSVAVLAGAGASFKPELKVVLEQTEIFTKVDVDASFDIKASEWVLHIPTMGNYAVIVGSGRDDIANTTEVIDFEDVAPNETVSVKAPVRTNLNVLLGGTRHEDTVLFPPEDRDWIPLMADADVGLTLKKYPYVATNKAVEDDDLLTAFSTLSTLTNPQAYTFSKTDTEFNNIVNQSYLPNMYRAVGGYAPGAYGVSALLDGTQNTRMLMLNSLSGQYSPNAVGNKVANLPGTIGCVFRAVDGTRGVLFSTTTSWSHSFTYMVVANNSVIEVRIKDTVVWSKPLIPGEFNAFAIAQLSASVANNGTRYGKNLYYTFRVSLNGVSESKTYTGSNWGWWDQIYVATNLTTIGKSPLVANATYPGKIFIENPFSTSVSMTVAQLGDVTGKLHALGQSVRQPSARTVRMATNALFMENGKVDDYSALYESAGWAYSAVTPLYAFFDGKKFYTIRRNASAIVEIDIRAEYDDLKGICADITTLRQNADILAAGTFSNHQLVCITKDEGRYKQLYGVPGQLSAVGTEIFDEYQLATDKTAAISYKNGEWKVKNLSGTTTDIRVAVMGGTLVEQIGGGVEKFIDLMDTPSTLLDLAPKTLVSHNGVVNKAAYIHPFLLRHI